MEYFSKAFQEFAINIKLQLGWLRAVAQGDNYNYNKIELGSNVQRIANSYTIKLSWGVDGCARSRKVTITVAIQLTW